MKIFLALALALFMSACTGVPGALQPPHVTLVNIVPATMTMFEQRYDLTLRVQNPNNAVLKIAGMNYAVTLNGQEFARGVSREAATIPPLGEEVVTVAVTSTALDWLRQIERLESRGAGQGFSYGVTGALHLAGAAGGRLDFAQQGTLFEVRE